MPLVINKAPGGMGVLPVSIKLASNTSTPTALSQNNKYAFNRKATTVVCCNSANDNNASSIGETSPGTQSVINNVLRVLPARTKTKQKSPPPKMLPANQAAVELDENAPPGPLVDLGDDTKPVCVVCRENVENGSRCIECPHCSARTHGSCLHRWFISQNELSRTAIARKGTCPCCRATIRWEEAVNDMRDRASGGAGRASGLSTKSLVNMSEKVLLGGVLAEASLDDSSRRASTGHRAWQFFTGRLR